MGVAGSGKTTIGQALAQTLGWNFSDADAFHSQAAKEKMAQGLPLNDEDRKPWLEAMQSAIDHWLMIGQNTVLACSSLKLWYRDVLRCSDPRVKLIYLQGSFSLFFERLKHRPNHYMKETMLQSQFDTLEEPSSSEAIYIDASQPPQAIAQKIVNHLNI
ncbi:gluconokinase [Coleofasciculus sp. LEGE 07092]|nr:gluconokinase [Coleofasciculus sp. LEGE 07081]MBE9147157.1 gluconokinase [Coleofasciculus sp. LEGE 07092]